MKRLSEIEIMKEVNLIRKLDFPVGGVAACVKNLHRREEEEDGFPECGLIFKDEPANVYEFEMDDHGLTPGDLIRSFGSIREMVSDGWVLD